MSLLQIGRIVLYSIFYINSVTGFLSRSSIITSKIMRSDDIASIKTVFNPYNTPSDDSICLLTTEPSIPKEANLIFTKAANIAAVHESASSTHQISDAIKSASYQLFLESERMEAVEHKLTLLNHDLHHKANDIGHEIGYMMVKIISSILPHVDTIGHKVLHMDDEIINYFINLDNLSPELKKKIILGIIHISQQGDHFGAQMLQLYYDIVNKLM